MMSSNSRSGDVVRAALVLLFALSQWTIAFFPEAIGAPSRIESTSQPFDTPLVPAGYAFIIWLFLYPGALWFAAAHAWPGNLAKSGFRQAGLLALISFMSNTAWAAYVPFAKPDLVAFILIVGITAPLLLLGLQVRRSSETDRALKAAVAPLLALAGWGFIATTVAATLTPLAMGWLPRFGVTESLFTLSAAAPILLGFAYALRSIAFTGASFWGLIAVAFANLESETQPIAFVALAISAVLIVVTLISRSRARRA